MSEGTVEVKKESLADLSRKHAENYSKIKKTETIKKHGNDGKVKMVERRILENGVIKEKIVDIIKDNKSIMRGKK